MLSALTLVALALCVRASPAKRAEDGWHVVGLGPRQVHPRDLSLADRLAWLESEASFLEGRYPGEGRAEPARLAKRAVPDVAPFDVAPAKRRREEQHKKRAQATAGLQDLYSVTDTSISDTAYLATAGIGTPAQSFRLQVDTGSAQTWVGSASAFSNAPVSKNTFVSSSSSTYRQTSSQIATLQYGSGGVQGSLGTDTVTIGGLSVPNQSLLVAQAVSPSFQAVLFDGLLGLAFSALSASGQPTFFENLVSSGQLTSPVFSLYVPRALDNATIVSSTSGLTSSVQGAAPQGLTSGGELTFGGFDSSRFTGNLTYAPLLQKSYWLVQQDGVYLNGQAIANSRIPSAIDSGTTLVLVPTAIASALASALGGRMAALSSSSNLQSTFLVIPCGTDTFEIDLGFAGQRFPLNISADLFMGPYDATGTYCVLGVLGRDVPQSSTAKTTYISVIGDSFLKVAYTVYNMAGAGSVGFAPAVQPGSSATSTTGVSNTNVGAINVGGTTATAAAGGAGTTAAVGATGNSALLKSGAPPRRRAALWMTVLTTSVMMVTMKLML